MNTTQKTDSKLALNAIKLSPSSGQERNLRRRLPEEKMREYERGRLGAYDHTTIFYDVFLEADNKTIVAIGPPPLNLKSLVLSARLNIGNHSLSFKVATDFKKLLVLKTKLPFTKAPSEPLVAELVFSDGQTQKITLADNHRLHGKALVTVQKNNKLRWIKDWIAYYRGEYGIEHVCIYDNNSNEQEKLREQLDGLAEVIFWNFPYGVISSSGNQFCQVGALNHFKLRHAGKALIFNFDIDEMLVCKNAKTKKRILSGELLRFNNYNVYSHALTGPSHSFSDFVLRMPAPRNDAYKYVVSGNESGILNVHYFQRNFGVMKKLLPESFVSGSVVPAEDAYFLHYMGISTNWNNNRGFASDSDLKSAVEDRSVNTVFERLKI